MWAIQSFWRNEAGAAAAEYALLTALIGAFVIAGMSELGQAISSAFTAAASAVSAVTY
jgi:Flp pilus assembly pilin Flp